MEKQFPLDIPLWDSVVVFSVSVEIVPVLSFPSENLTLKQFIKWHINAAVTTKTTIILIIPPINDRCCLRYAYLVCLVDIRAIDQRSKVQFSFLLVRHFHVVSASVADIWNQNGNRLDFFLSSVPCCVFTRLRGLQPTFSFQYRTG